MHANRGKGKGIAFLRGLIGHQGNDCIPWPLARDRHGYGECGFEGKLWRAHRLMCALAHGEPPTPAHHASHNCGKGHLGCVNPKHLEWKTASGNQYDRRKHGTHGGGGGRWQKLTPAQWQEIREAKGKITNSALAKKYGVAEGTITGIQGRRWGTSSGTKMITHRGRTMRVSEWAKEIGITDATLRWRLAKMPETSALDMPKSASFLARSR